MYVGLGIKDTKMRFRMPRPFENAYDIIFIFRVSICIKRSSK